MLGLTAGLWLMLGATVAPVSFESRTVSFSSQGETLTEITARLTQELGEPIGVARKLSGQRLLIYAPDVPSDELLENIAQSVFGEWIRQPDGTLMLDRTPRGQAELERVAAAQVPGPDLSELRAVLREAGKPLSESEMKAWAEGLRAVVRNAIAGTETPGGGGSQGLLNLQKQTPEFRLLFRLVDAVLDNTAARQVQQGSVGPQYSWVVSTRPTHAEVDARPFAPALLTQLRAEAASWQMMAAQEGLAQIESPSSFAYNGNFQRILASFSSNFPNDEFAARITVTATGFSVEFTFFDSEGNAVGTPLGSGMDYRQDPRWAQAGDGIDYELWVEANQHFMPGLAARFPDATRKQILLHPHGFDKLRKFHYDGIAEVGRLTGYSIIRPLPDILTQLHLAETVDVAGTARRLQSMAMNESIPEALRAVTLAGTWIVERSSSMSDSESWTDYEGIAEYLNSISGKEVMGFDDLIRLAVMSGSDIAYQLIVAYWHEREGRNLEYPRLRYRDALFLSDIVRHDFRRIRAGASVAFHQLNPSSKEVVYELLNRSFFITGNPDQIQLNLRPDVMPDPQSFRGNRRSFAYMPTQRFPDGIPSQAKVELHSIDRTEVRGPIQTEFGTALVTFFPQTMAEILYRSEQTGEANSLDSLFVTESLRLVIQVSYEDVAIHHVIDVAGAPPAAPISWRDLPPDFLARVNEYLTEYRERGEIPPPRPITGNRGGTGAP